MENDHRCVESKILRINSIIAIKMNANETITADTKYEFHEYTCCHGEEYTNKRIFKVISSFYHSTMTRTVTAMSKAL